MRFSADQMHYAYCVWRPQAYTELIDCMRKGLRTGREIIDAAARWKSKRTATAAVRSPMKRFKLSLPVDQRKGSDRWSHSYIRFVRNNRVGRELNTRTQTTDQDLITTRRGISALQRNLGIISFGAFVQQKQWPAFLPSMPLNFSSSWR